MPEATIGVIGGSGSYAMEGLEQVERVELNTPFGTPSDTYVLGTIAGQRVAFLPRHGVGHRLTPSEVPSRANIHGFKQLGARFLISISAVGGRRDLPSRRDAGGDGGAAVFDIGRERGEPPAWPRPDRHDRAARGQAGARG